MRMGAQEFGALPTAGLRVTIASLFLLPLLLWRGLGPQLAAHWKKAVSYTHLTLPTILRV